MSGVTPCGPIEVVGRGEQGLLLGVGRLLRELTVRSSGEVVLAGTPGRALSLAIEPPPFGKMRGHQVRTVQSLTRRNIVWVGAEPRR